MNSNRNHFCVELIQFKVECLVLIGVMLLICCAPVRCQTRNHKQLSSQRSKIEQKTDRRTIQFPKDVSIGALVLTPSDTGHGDDGVRSAREVAIARGSVVVDVPEGKLLTLVANRRVVQSPNLLTQISPSGLDGLKLAFISMKEDEDGICDQALKLVPGFKNLSFLDVEQSDATDAGLSNLRSLVKLKELAANECLADGSFLKSLSALAKLRSIEMGRCPLQQSNLVYLADLPSLDHVSLRWCGLDESGFKYLSKCPKLRMLNVSRNKGVNDRCMKYLISLKGLRELDLTETSVTLAGIELLAPLKLDWLKFPRSAVHTKGDAAKIKKWFPSAKIFLDMPGETVPEDVNILFGPHH